MDEYIYTLTIDSDGTCMVRKNRHGKSGIRDLNEVIEELERIRDVINAETDIMETLRLNDVDTDIVFEDDDYKVTIECK